jgi:nucleoid-associated protein YgaU
MTSYGDPTAWTTIAKANGLTDPVINGVQTILVPPLPGSSGGVLSA